MERGSFRFADFYMRRIRRIFPALIVVLLCVLVVAPLILFPDEYAMLGKHVLCAAGFLSNIVLWRESGYFDVDSNTKILLHFWSLGIEEQFYICFPLLLLLCFKKAQVLLPLALLFLLSFGETLYLGAVNKTAAFYSPFSRAWELLAGALLSALHRSPRTHEFFLRLEGTSDTAPGRQTGTASHAPGLVLAAGGGVCIALALGITDAKAVWPGWKALLPVLGTVLLIAAGSANPVNRYLLSSRAAVFIGRISYPFYLWHWPLLVYAGFITDTEQMTLSLRCILVGSAFLLATMTYLGVERPIRFQKKTSPRILAGLCATLGILGVWGGYIYVDNHVDQFNHKILDRLKASNKTINLLPEFSHKYIDCKSSAPLEKVNIAVIGDSHAQHLFPGLVNKLKHQKHVALFSASCTPPYLGIARSVHGELLSKDSKDFTTFIQKSYSIILSQKNITTVILAHNPKCSYGNIDLIDIYNPALKDRTQILETGMRRTFSALTQAGKKIIVLLDTPRLPFEPKVCKKRPFSFSEQNFDCTFEKKLFATDKAFSWYKMLLERVIKDYPAVTMLDLSPYFCDEVLCYAKKDGKLLYYDTNHLSYAGSLLVAPEIIKAFEALSPAAQCTP